MNTARTPAELKNQEYNYYLAFRIEPTENDMAKIKMAIDRGSMGGHTNPIERRLRDLRNEAVEIMTNNSLREEEYQSAKKFKFDAAKKTFEIIAKIGKPIYKSDLEKIATTSRKWLTAEEIEMYLQRQGIKVINGTSNLVASKNTTPATRNFDFNNYMRIKTALKIIDKKDLYDFLGKSPNASVSELINVLQTEGSRAFKSSNFNANLIARRELLGLAMPIFKDINKKKYYDIYLSTKDIWDDFATLSSSGIPELNENGFSMYFENAKNTLKPFNLANADVKNLLNEGLNFFRIAVMVAGGGNNVEILGRKSL